MRELLVFFLDVPTKYVYQFGMERVFVNADEEK